MEHEPGGKVQLSPLEGVVGSASFSQCGRYRYLLHRGWGNPGSGWALWIGLNPSTADATFDDPTVRREIIFTKRMGLGGYIKANLFDYRATDPKKLLEVEHPMSPHNIDTIILYAMEATILCYGAVHKRLRPDAHTLLAGLLGAGVALYCLGRTKHGHPRHPLYLRSDTELVPFSVVL